MTRPQLPVQEALAALSQEDEGTVRLAARLVGQAKPQTNQARSSVETALNKWWQIWETRRTQLDRGIGQLSHIHAAGAVLQNLFWTATQTGSPAAMLNDIALSRRDDPLARSLRLDAVRALATRPITAASVSTFAQLALGADAEVRTFSASILAHGDAPKAATLAKEFLLDAPSFSRVTAAGVEVLAVAQQAIRQSHSQPVALPTLLAAKDVNALSVVARDRNAAESVRLGAVEGLGFLGLETAEAALLELGRTQNDDEDIRKAAWKALQRSRRKRKKRVRSA
jgi:ParB family chromosome partitioning protein